MTSLTRRPGLPFLSSVPTGVILFCCFFSLYIFTIYGQLRYGDEAERYLQAKSLVDSHTFVIPFIPGEGQTGVGGNAYNQFEMGYGLVVIPFYALGRFFSSFYSFADADWIPILFVSLSNPLITALTCVVLFAFARALGFGARAAIGSTIVFGLGTIAWPYSKSLDREALQSLCLLLAVYAIYRARLIKSDKWIIASGSAFGFLVLTKIANLITLPVFLGYIAIILSTNHGDWKSRERWTRILKSATLFTFPIMVCLVFQGIIDVIKFGNFFNIGPYNYGNPLPYFSLSNLVAGVMGLMFSPEKGLFLYAPPTLLFLPALFLFSRRNKVDAVFILVLIVLNILFAGSYFSWQGGSYWGPRYLVELVPLLVLPFGLLWEVDVGRTRWLGVIASAVFAVGIGVQVLAAFTDDREYPDIIGRWIDIPGAFDFFRHGGIHSLMISLEPGGGFEISPYAGVLIVFFVGCGLLLLIRAIHEQIDYPRLSPWGGTAIPVLMFLAPIGGLVAVFLPNYPTALAAQGNTKYVAAESFYADGRFCEAKSFYSEALYFGTVYSKQSASRLSEITPAAVGPEVEIGKLAGISTEIDSVKIESDSVVTLLGDSSLKIAASPGKAVDFEADSPFFSVDSNVQYELSGWLKLEGIAVDGSANISWYEDNGRWSNPRNLDFIRTSGTRGWMPFRTVILTAPTTKRALLKVILGHSNGTIWIEGLRLVQVDQRGSARIKPLCAQ